MTYTITNEQSTGVLILDDFIREPEHYRNAALKNKFARIDFGHIAFDGIAIASLETGLPKLIEQRFPQLKPELSVFRKSPKDQKEPNFIHCDVELGDWTAVLYLNPWPDVRDGTDFWVERETGALHGPAEHAVTLKAASQCDKWRHVSAKFNRLLMFPADYFHSRALYENYGEGDNARLIQVVFGRGEL
jgi:hypothetical protein